MSKLRAPSERRTKARGGLDARRRRRVNFCTRRGRLIRYAIEGETSRFAGLRQDMQRRGSDHFQAYLLSVAPGVSTF
jgi:hypothetical protein